MRANEEASQPARSARLIKDERTSDRESRRHVGGGQGWTMRRRQRRALDSPFEPPTSINRQCMLAFLALARLNACLSRWRRRRGLERVADALQPLSGDVSTLPATSSSASSRPLLCNTGALVSHSRAETTMPTLLFRLQTPAADRGGRRRRRTRGQQRYVPLPTSINR